MTPTSEKTHLSPRKNVRSKPWNLNAKLLVLLLFAVFGVWASMLSQATTARSFYAPSFGNLPIKSSLAPDDPDTATATATVTGLSDPSATQTLTPLATSQATAVVIRDFVNLRAGPSTDYGVVQELSFGDKLILLAQLSDNSWLYVQTLDGKEGWIITSMVDYGGRYIGDLPVKASPPTVIPTPYMPPEAKGHWIDIDLSEQRLFAMDGPDVISTFLVSTGVPEFPTRTGEFHIYAKFLFSDMMGNGYYLPNVPWAMYYDNDFSIHGTYWHHNFGTRMSHGCVNMDIPDAEWVYNWAPVGTLVNIHF